MHPLHLPKSVFGLTVLVTKLSVWMPDRQVADAKTHQEIQEHINTFLLGWPEMRGLIVKIDDVKVMENQTEVPGEQERIKDAMNVVFGWPDVLPREFNKELL